MAEVRRLPVVRAPAALVLPTVQPGRGVAAQAVLMFQPAA